MNDDKALDGSTPESQIDYWRHRALKAEKVVEDLKDIGRAKVKMAGEMGFAEPEAHRYLQKRAMDERRSMGDLARDILQGVTHGT
jgi:AmiR/NasT family two-component response regulator